MAVTKVASQQFAERMKPKAYIKEGCPYSFKFLLFMAEAKLLHGVDIIRCDPAEDEFEGIKDMLSRATGKPATFPTVEVEPKRYLTDSDRLIDYFATQYDIDQGALPALEFYRRSIFPQLDELHRND